MKPLAGVLLLMLAAPLASAAPATKAGVKEKIQDTRLDMKQLQKRRIQEEQALKSVAKREQSLMGQLEQLNRELESARREAKTHVQNLGLVEDRLQRIRGRLDVLSREEGEDRASLRRSLAALYKARGRRGPALLFGSRTPAELSARTRYLGALSQGTERRIRALNARISQVKGFQEDYAARQEELLKRRLDVDAARRKVEQERLRRQGLLKTVRTQKAQKLATLKDLERSFGRLQGLLGKLQKEALRQAQARKSSAGGKYMAPSAVGGASTLRKGLAWPARGRLLSNYGKQKHPLFNTPVFNRGIEIAAAHGSPVYAVAGGTVLHAAAMEGFGELVVLDHGGGMMSVYGYGSKTHVSPGQGVASGDLIAEVGEAGTSRQPSLYFEIRKGAKALNPFLYLRRR